MLVRTQKDLELFVEAFYINMCLRCNTPFLYRKEGCGIGYTSFGITPVRVRFRCYTIEDANIVAKEFSKYCYDNLEMSVFGTNVHIDMNFEIESEDREYSKTYEIDMSVRESRRYKNTVDVVTNYNTHKNKEEVVMHTIPEIEKITQQDGWTIIKYKDGTHTRVHLDDGVSEEFVGFTVAVCKKLFGDNKSFKKVQEMYELKSLPVKEQEKVLKAKADRKAKADKDMEKHNRKVARKEAKERK